MRMMINTEATDCEQIIELLQYWNRLTSEERCIVLDITANLAKGGEL